MSKLSSLESTYYGGDVSRAEEIKTLPKLKFQNPSIKMINNQSYKAKNKLSPKPADRNNLT